MKLKRKLCYKGHYMYAFVRPVKVLAALDWLKQNNPLYKDIQINRAWVESAVEDNPELWSAFSSQECDLPAQPPNNGSREHDLPAQLPDSGSREHDVPTQPPDNGQAAVADLSAQNCKYLINE